MSGSIQCVKNDDEYGESMEIDPTVEADLDHNSIEYDPKRAWRDVHNESVTSEVTCNKKIRISENGGYVGIDVKQDEGKRKMRPTDILPSTGIDILIVGNGACKEASHSLASALVRCKVENGHDMNFLQNYRENSSWRHKNLAGFSETQSLHAYLNARHIRITQTFPIRINEEHCPRVDFISIIISVRDAQCLDNLRMYINHIHSDFFTFRRCALIIAGANDRQKYAVPVEDIRSLFNVNKVCFYVFF